MTKISSKIRFLFHNKTFFKTIFGKIFIRRNKSVSEKSVNKEANSKLNYKFDCSSPRTFNEHVSWIKINYRNEMWKRCADKLGSKSFLIDNNLSKYVIKTYKVYNASSEINLDELPEQFVLKTNHDSGTVFICDKKTTNFKKVFEALDKSLKRKYSEVGGEWVYEDIKPVIFAEEIIRPRVGKQLIDYKLFAFNGVFGWGFTGQNRNVDTRFVVFEGDFAPQDVEYIYLRPPLNMYPPKPNCFEEMVDVSKRISQLLDFVRVDFYDTNDGPKIGELTFFSQNGMGPFTKKEYDFKYGGFFKETKLFSLINKDN